MFRADAHGVTERNAFSLKMALIGRDEWSPGAPFYALWERCIGRPLTIHMKRVIEREFPILTA